jgi:membrane protease YdiL (CAAX protease family)
MVSKNFGQIKGPFIVWLFVVTYFAIPILFGGSSKGTLPQEVPVSLVLNLLIAMALGWGGILVFLVIFLALRERRRSLTEIFSSVGLKTKGAVKSVFWSIVITPLFLVLIGVMAMMFNYFLGPMPTLVSDNGQIPLWFLYYIIVSSFFPVVVVEEAIARGYILDRLLPEHPSSLVKALPAILLGSLLFTLYHLPSYLGLYSFSTPRAVALLVGNVFPWSAGLSIAYVRARTRNIIGPVLIHFLADSMPIILMLV